MALGIDWVNNSCENISGCDWIVDSVDYVELFSLLWIVVNKPVWF